MLWQETNHLCLNCLVCWKSLNSRQQKFLFSIIGLIHYVKCVCIDFKLFIHFQIQTTSQIYTEHFTSHSTCPLPVHLITLSTYHCCWCFHKGFDKEKKHQFLSKYDVHLYLITTVLSTLTITQTVWPDEWWSMNQHVTVWHLIFSLTIFPCALWQVLQQYLWGYRPVRIVMCLIQWFTWLYSTTYTSPHQGQKHTTMFDTHFFDTLDCCRI